MTTKKENETSLIYPIHTFLRAILGDKCEKIVRKGGERGKKCGNLSLIPKTCVISWSNIIESTSYSWKIDVCSKNWKILPVVNFQPMMERILRRIL